MAGEELDRESTMLGPLRYPCAACDQSRGRSLLCMIVIVVRFLLQYHRSFDLSSRRVPALSRQHLAIGATTILPTIMLIRHPALPPPKGIEHIEDKHDQIQQ